MIQKLKIKNVLASVIRLPWMHRLSGGVPKHVWVHSRDWVESISFGSAQRAAKWVRLRHPDITEQPSPIRLNPDDPDFYKWNRPWKNFGTFVLEAKNLRYESITDSVLTPGHGLLYDLSRQWPDKPQEHALLRAIRFPSPVFLPGRSLVLSVRDGGKNYHNWMTSLVPRLKLVLDAGYQIKDFDHILVNRCESGFREETLRAMGIPVEKVVESDSHRLWHMPDVVVPSLPYQAGFSRKWALDYLCSLFQDSTEEAGERIYISRKDARLRRVVNEDELLEALIPLGFKSVSFTNMTVAAQAAIMKKARLVVAPHGAGLTNLAFAPNRIDVLELHSRDYYSSTFWWISTRKENRHAVLCSTPKRSDANWPDQGIWVDVAKVRDYLKNLLNEQKEPTES